MKLWQKIFLCTFLLVMTVVDLTAILLVGNSHNLMVQREKEHAVSRQEYLVSSLQNELVFRRWQLDRYSLEKEEVAQTVLQMFDEWSLEEGAAVFCGGELISTSNLSLTDEKKALMDEADSAGSYHLKIIEEGEGYRLLTASLFQVENEDYFLLTETDVSEIFQLRRSQFQFAIWMSILCSAAASIVLLLILHFLLKPLDRINRTVDVIAGGNYDERFSEGGSSEFQELSQNLNRMTQSIQENIDKLEDAAEARKMFIANLAHEMKTPLTSILGFGDVLRVKKTVKEEDRREYAGVIVEETKRLRALSSKLMELITVGSSVLDYRQMDLYDVMQGAVKALEPVFANSGLRLVCSPAHHTVRIDRELFESLLYNVLENAAKASCPGGSVFFRCESREGRVAISVEDQGIGMSQEEIRNIFEPFYMVDQSRSRKSGGAGLGLALCQEIARAHEANIQVASEPGKGTIITIVLHEKM